MQKDIKDIKKKMLEISWNRGHMSSSYSSVEILYTLYTTINITKDNLKDFDNRDMVIISKEHCRLAQVCILAHLGFVNKELLNNWLLDNGVLGHDIYNYVSHENLAAIDYGSGSLGHGLGVAIGLAMAKPNRNIYVLIGDGEMQEGSLWEAFLYILQRKLNNLTIICDRNYMQIEGYTKDIVDTSSNMENVMKTLGFDVLCCNGHNIEEIKKCIKQSSAKPKFIFAETIKGKGIEFLRQEMGYTRFHHGVLNESQKDRAMEAISNEQ